MQDIILWKLLHTSDPDPQRLLALLGELAALPAAERWPFMGRAADLVKHKDPALRAVALRVLAGAGGYPGFRAIVPALSDPDDAVRDEALDAFCASSASDADRWAQGLGYTRFEQSKVWISPLPILRDEQHAEAVTRGLIVHEFGHHMYHRSPDALAVWKEAENGGYHGLLNLVSDEHLERNLRSIDEDFGDDLKKLAAYAFQHSNREISVADLLACLQSRAVAVLSRSSLGVARMRSCVSVDNGAVLLEMERQGMSFARFVRALRMTRRMHICCAQVAVCPLEHKCFPHYVEVLDEDFSAAVRRFGSIITRLVQQITRL